MKNDLAARAAVAVAALCLAAGLLFAALAAAPTPDPGPPPDPNAPGEVLFGRYCGECHTPAEVETLLRAGGPDLEASLAGLLEFLKIHGEANEAQDAAIVDFLRRRLR